MASGRSSREDSSMAPFALGDDRVLCKRILDLFYRIQPYLRHVPDVTHTEIENVRLLLLLRTQTEPGAREQESGSPKK